MKRQKGRVVLLASLAILFICREAYSQRGGSVKLLAYYETPVSEAPYWVYNPPDPMVLNPAGTGPTFLTLHVPPAKGSQALIFEIDANALFTEATGTPELEIRVATHWLAVKSKLIPSNVAVEISWRMAYTVVLPQDGFRPALIYPNFCRVVKFPLWASEEAWWQVYDIDTGEELPPGEKIALLRKLIDNGFDLDCLFRVRVKGISEVRLQYYDIFVYSTDLAPYSPPAGALSILWRPKTKDDIIR